MKKLMTLMLVLFSLAASDASAGYGRRGRGFRSCWGGSCRVERACPTACPTVCPVAETVARPCKVDYVNEEACPAVPCCVRYVRVEEPAEVTKNISYSVSCPSGCTPEQESAGMMKAGETINY